MEFRKNRLTISEAKEKDMVTVLLQMGFEAVKVSRNDHWYRSPLRNESSPSFKVNRRLNRWYDHGLGKGGNLVDFAVLLWSCNLSEALKKLSVIFSLQQHPLRPFKIVSKQEAQIQILSASTLSSKALLNYFHQRGIASAIAHQFYCQLRYELNGKTGFGIGFKNDFGGYEIRNAFHKLSSSPKGITSFKNGSDSVAIFEGFFDFLSFMVVAGENIFKDYDFIILNSLAFLEGTRHILDSYSNVLLFLDNDIAGKAATKLALTWSDFYRDKSSLYEGYTDVNDWLVNSGLHTKIPLADILPIKEKPPNLP